MGLAIGKEGVNVNEVRRMDGIVSVEFEDHSSMFRVRAEVSRLVWASTRAWCHEGVCFTFFLRHKRRWPEQENDCSTQRTQSSSQETLQVGSVDNVSLFVMFHLYTHLSLLTTGKVIGKRGDIIQVILEKSKVNNVRVVGDEEAKQRNLDVTTQV